MSLHVHLIIFSCISKTYELEYFVLLWHDIHTQYTYKVTKHYNGLLGSRLSLKLLFITVYLLQVKSQ